LSILTKDGAISDPYRNFIAVSRYSRWLEEEGRRETWAETVGRYFTFMKQHMSENYPKVKIDWKRLENAVLNHEVMPSMRGLMTAGPALARENLAQFNCSFIAVDDLRAFDEALYILMNGVGLGFSVESQHVLQLPTINEHFEHTSSTIVVADSKSGWARGFRELIALLWQGQIPRIDISNVRPAGARLKTFGGRASGPQPLVDLFDFTIGIVRGAAGRKLTPHEAHRIMCKIGEVVVVGGVRRSALLGQSDLNDYEMAHAKSGAWWEDKPELSLANNSAVFYKKPSIGEFLQFAGDLYESKSGERGIMNMEGLRNHTDAPRRDLSKVQGLNPCAEILLRSKQLCNLTEVIVNPNDTLDDLESKVNIATILGTIQSSLTDFKYLRKAWKDNCNEERLLGVSLTGQMDHHMLNGFNGLDTVENWLTIMKKKAISTNERYAKKMGINASTAITTVKPSGTVSQLTNSASGMHPRHAKYYIRTVRADNKDPLTTFLNDVGIPNEPDVMKPETSTVFSFPQKSPDLAMTREDLTALEQLEIWKVYKRFWTEHNPSITISVREDEWIEVFNWVYENWQFVGGISFLPYRNLLSYHWLNMVDTGGISMPENNEADDVIDYGDDYEAPEGVVVTPASEALPYPDVVLHDDPEVLHDDIQMVSFVGGGGRTPEQAIATARDWSKRGLFFGVGQCLATTRKYYNVASKYGTAFLSWQAADHKHFSDDGRDAPRGAPVWWTGGSSGAGHVAISVGGGVCLTTDWKRPGKIDYAHINDITTAWGLDYKGWTREINDVVVWRPRPPRDVVHLRNLRPGERNEDVLKVKHALHQKGYTGFLVTSNKYGNGIKRAYAKFQKRLGYSGPDANGVPGPNSLQKLGFRVL
jgi:ribonucleoside-triphosphate reductase